MSYHYLSAQELYADIADEQRRLAYRLAKEQDESDYNPYEGMEDWG